MFLHASIPADNPKHVAEVLAELWKGEVTLFPPFPQTYMCWSSHAGCEVEIVPRGWEQRPGDKHVELVETASPTPYNEVHFLFATPLNEDEMLAIAQREGWLARKRNTGGIFLVVEVWLENKFLIELVSPAEKERYLARMNPQAFKKMTHEGYILDVVRAH